MEECFRRLEERVREVLQGYKRLRQEREVLADTLRLKDKDIDELDRKLKALDEKKDSVKARIERLIQRIEGLGL